jgi:hypothetical protein
MHPLHHRCGMLFRAPMARRSAPPEHTTADTLQVARGSPLPGWEVADIRARQCSAAQALHGH